MSSGPSSPGAADPRPRNHAPATPSGLRQSYTPRNGDGGSQGPIEGSPGAPGTGVDPLRSRTGPGVPVQSSDSSETTSLLGGASSQANHQTFSPRPSSPAGSDPDLESTSVSESEGLLPPGNDASKSSWRTALSSRMKSKKMARAGTLAKAHGFKDSPLMYLSYYIPCLVWMRQYKWAWFRGDLVSALTLASMYLPMALSYADNLAHVPAVHGLYAFVFNPFIYGILGSCPQMVVGPEAAGSLLTGSTVEHYINSGRGGEDDDALHGRIAGVAVGMAGASVFIMGLCRLGFLDSVLSRPFLRGFVSAIGLVIFIDQIVPVLGLSQVQKHTEGIAHGSSVTKIQFLFTRLGDAHRLSAIVGVVSFAVIMVFREIKSRLQPRYPGVAYLPDRLMIVVVSAVLAWQLRWEEKGVEVLGDVHAASGRLFTFHNPFQLSHITHIRDAMGTSFLIGMLGFFESSVAAKSLGGAEVIEGMQLSANRELIALGAANIVGAGFMAIPAFGGYGRSKVNKSTGGRSPMSSILLSILTVICVLFFLPWFYYLPKPVLSALIVVVAYSLIEEAPHDIAFFYKIRGWTELSLMAIILLVTVFFSLNLGIVIGIGISLLQVIRHSTRPRIQILGRMPGTDRFENAEYHPERLEFVEGCLIVKIPEPLTFANTGELKSRLRRLELYGTGEVHPALPRLRPRDSNTNVIFDIHGVTSMDGSGAQVLEEIVRSYRDRGVRVFFSRPPGRRHPVWKLMERSGIVSLVGGERHFVDDIREALRMTEQEDFEETGACAAASDLVS